MDDRGQTSTEYLLLTAVGVLLAVMGYLAIMVLIQRAKDALQTVDTYRVRLVQTLAG